MPSVTNIAYYGDSITQGASGTNIADGAPGSWVEQNSGLLTQNHLPELIGTGFRGLWLGGFFNTGSTTHSGEWDGAGTWAGPLSQSDVNNKAPHGQTWYGANGSGSTATWTKPASVRPIVGFAVYYIDYASVAATNAGNWQYSIDGGTWTNMGETIANDGKLKKFYVNTAVTSTVAFRQYTGTVSAGLMLVGIEGYYADPRTTTGTIAHNLGRYGFPLSVSGSMINKGTNDAWAWYDDCVLGTNAVAHKPIFSTLEFVNDFAFFAADGDGGAARWLTNLTALWTRASQIGIPFILLGMYEMDFATNTVQDAYRNNSISFAAGTTSPLCYLLNIFTEWRDKRGLGGSGVQSVNDKPLYVQDGTHPSIVGSTDIAIRLHQFILDNALVTPSGLSYASPFTNGSSQLGTDQLVGTPSVLANAADTATGTDGGESIAATLTDGDTSTATDGGEGIALTTADTASGTDGGEAIAATLTDADTATGTDAGEAIAATLTNADTVAGTDAGEAIAATLTDGDTVGGTDAEGIAVPANDGDTATFTDGGESIAVTLTDNESVTGTELESIAATLADSDSVAATDAATIAAALADADTLAATDGGESIASALADSDSATATEAQTLVVTITDSDTLTATEAQLVTPVGGGSRVIVVHFGKLVHPWRFSGVAHGWTFTSRKG